MRADLKTGFRHKIIGAGLLLLTALSLSAQKTVTTPTNGTASPASQGTLPGQGAAAATSSANPTTDANTAAQQQDVAKGNSTPVSSSIWTLSGLPVDSIRFEGVEFSNDDPFLSSLPIHAGEKLDTTKVRETIRRLYATGFYRDLDLRGIPTGTAADRHVALIFYGTPRYFIGRVRIDGVPIERLASILQYATQLEPGTPFTRAQVSAGQDGIIQSLHQNGYYESKIVSTVEPDDAGRQMNITYTVNIGAQSRIGQVTVEGKDPGITIAEFRKRGSLKENHKVTRDTTSNALTKLRTQYQKKDRLEAAVSLQKSDYTDGPKHHLDYTFGAEQGPIVKVIINGAKISKVRQKQLLPIYEESAIDNDLLNEGAHNIREYLERQGYFDAQVDPHVEGAGSASTTVIFDARPGDRYRVTDVTVTGNKYFAHDTIAERMQVVKADTFVRNGRYSQSLLQNDVDSIQSLYRSNGFTQAKVDNTIKKGGTKGKLSLMSVALVITEGPQQKFGEVTINGIKAARMQYVRGMMGTISGQPFSLTTVSEDRDSILQYYLAHGFDQANVEVKQVVDANDKSRTNEAFLITEGEQVFVDHLLVSGVHHTRPSIVTKQFLLKPGDPLNQSALVEMQRRYYNLALFNEANVAIQNPAGRADRKNVLVQLTESRRWDVTYGAGFEAETGRPQTNCRAQESLNAGSTNCTPAGQSGASFLVSLDVSRINLRGTDNSITLHTTYGLLEKIATLTYNSPHLFGHENFTGSVTGGYSNVQNISTFQASTLQGDLRLTQKIPRADTLIYDLIYRRVSVNQDSLQVTANLIPLLSEPVRVGGPQITWLHDTRSPSPLDAQRGMYLSVQDFYANKGFGSETKFNRLDATYSTYYTWGSRRKYTFARNTRFGVENSSGTNPNASNVSCMGVQLTTNGSCNLIPLPERLYGGGASSHRGFAINSAGPRDLTTGFPVGGSAVFINQLELRLPPPTLPFVGSSVSFVIFHDMGNVFIHPGDVWPSFARFHQPNQNTCKNVTTPPGQPDTPGICSFNYFSHAIGLGARYNTPVGPIRVDFSYNLNPPLYPVIDDFSQALPNPHAEQAGHFNFFFSIGQTF